jgi:hypothetical protein
VVFLWQYPTIQCIRDEFLIKLLVLLLKMIPQLLVLQDTIRCKWFEILHTARAHTNIYILLVTQLRVICAEKLLTVYVEFQSILAFKLAHLVSVY